MIRLPFALPAFARITWASPGLRATWEGRMAAVRGALLAARRPRAWRGLVPARVLEIYPHQERALIADAAAEGMRVERLDGVPAHLAGDGLASGKCILVAVGGGEAIAAVRRASDRDAWERAVGTPACCVDAGARMRAQAFRSGDVELFVSTFPDAEAGGCVRAPQRWQTNRFWRGVGIDPLLHQPCALGCEASRALGDALHARLATEHADEAGWLREMLAWSMSWSILHGIAELKTPIFKASMAADATAHRYELQLRGARPADAAAGVGFPYEPRSLLGYVAPRS